LYISVLKLARRHTEIQTVLDEDDVEWASYLETVEWCRQQGIRTITDLDNREVSEHMEARTLENTTVGLETDPALKSELCAAILASLCLYMLCDLMHQENR
jgi:hypothetical protein